MDENPEEEPCLVGLIARAVAGIILYIVAGALAALMVTLSAATRLFFYVVWIGARLTGCCIVRHYSYPMGLFAVAIGILSEDWRIPFVALIPLFVGESLLLFETERLRSFLVSLIVKPCSRAIRVAAGRLTRAAGRILPFPRGQGSSLPVVTVGQDLKRRRDK